jgi:hypothetical protein
MITPFSPPPARVELLRVRRVDPTGPANPSGPSPLRDLGDLFYSQSLRVDEVVFSDEALRLLVNDLRTREKEKN